MLKQYFSWVKIVFESSIPEFNRFYSCNINLGFNSQINISKEYLKLETN